MTRIKDGFRVPLAALLGSAAVTAVAAENLAGTFKIIGSAGVGAMLTVQATPNTVFIVDKAENNALHVAGHPAWATAYDLRTNTIRPMDVPTNTFCAAGVLLGDGTILNAGGDQQEHVMDNVDSKAVDGRRRLRLLAPCDDGTCQWQDRPDLQMNSQRWYPTLEVLEDGSSIIIGGSLEGGYVNPGDNPTYEYYPSRGADRKLTFLERTYPLNLYPLVWLLPDSRLFVQADYRAINFDHINNVEQALPDIPHSFRVYPASASHWLTPLTAENNYTHTINFCGGVTLTKDELVGSVDGPPKLDVLKVPADKSCTSIRPLDASPAWTDFDWLPEGRIMGNAIILPDLTILVINGAGVGTAGYGVRGEASWMSAGSSYADSPTLTPVIYDPNRPKGKRWSSEGLSASTIPRMYHSTAILLNDGSIFVSGSNPNADVVPLEDRYGTEYRVERFYPPYFSASRRPQPKGLPDKLSYGGEPFTIELSKEDIGDEKNIKSILVTYVRPGYSTHAINFSQRAIKLKWSYKKLDNGGIKLFVQQLPSPTIFPPGPALLHVVVAGIPSEGKFVMAGNGKIGTQTVLPLGDVSKLGLPPTGSTKPVVDPSGKAGDGSSDSGDASGSSGGDSNDGGSTGDGSGGDKSAATTSVRMASSASLAAASLLVLLASVALF
ncbi:glyoxal oxidase N-terminus-domain-containing protein [Cercophora newfieldiana]|uniref:Glyoxal oxidase N-terminus-domain-containing protein n=1 Tax=Cercophora newfieldiana TaxID=92897 RepID=A0AA40CRL7_9PEZI|nr:glyoxal oxidase N-terminus-domain-containing protein [Cercophora newfieldiana]